MALRKLNPKRIIMAVPVGAAETCEKFENEVDEVVCGKTPEDFGGSERGTRISRRRLTRKFASSWIERRSPITEHEMD